MKQRNGIDDDSVRALSAAQKQRRLLVEDSFAFVMGSEKGRRLVWHLIDTVSGALSPSFTGNSETFYREGRRSVGLDLMADVQRLHPELYVQMLNEQIRENARIAQQEEKDRG